MADEKIIKTEEDWKKELTSEQYKVLRAKGTEAPFTGALLHNQEKGTYRCGACGYELFSSETKFDSGSGWPSFWEPVSGEHVDLREDKSFGMKRIEAVCSRCGSHLGHVFDDGPTSFPENYEGQGSKPTGKRFCINSASLKFKKQE